MSHIGKKRKSARSIRSDGQKKPSALTYRSFRQYCIKNMK